MTELERELLEALKAMLQVFGGPPNTTLWEVVDAREVVARAEAKAKEPQCKCVCGVVEPYKHVWCGKPYYNQNHVDTYCFNEAPDRMACAHDRACHIVGGEG